MRDPSTETEKLLLEQLYGYVMIVLTVEPAELHLPPHPASQHGHRSRRHTPVIRVQ